MGDGICHMRKGTRTGKEEIYLHREKPSLNLFPSLTDYCYDDALKAEYREQIPEEAYTEEEAFRAKHSLKRKEG